MFGGDQLMCLETKALHTAPGRRSVRRRSVRCSAPSAAPSELLKWVVEPVLRILDRNVAREVLQSLKTGYRRKRAAAAGRRRRSLHVMARRRRSDEQGSTSESRRDRRNRWLAVASERI